MGLVRNTRPKTPGGYNPSDYMDYISAAIFHLDAALGEMGKANIERGEVERAYAVLQAIVSEGLPSTTGGNK